MTEMTARDVLEEEERWRKHLDTLDSGDYIEAASPEYKGAHHVVACLECLADALIKYERAGHPLPKGKAE